MKTLKTTIRKTNLLAMALLLALSFSCSPEDGKDGAVGPQGPTGQNGIDGQNGVDGNANVQTYVFDISSISGTSQIELVVPELTQEVIDQDLVLTYLRSVNSNIYISVPGVGTINDHFLDAEITVGKITVTLWNTNLSSELNLSGDYDLAKVIIAESLN